MADFRYTLGDIEVEAYQITEATRYQDKLWPEWIDSRWFMTVDGATWIKLGGEELPFPYLSWLVNKDGAISVCDPFKFEEYSKVVPVEPETFDEPVEHTATVVSGDDGLLFEVMAAFILLKDGKTDEAALSLRVALSQRTQWCNCAPGQCENADPIGCREKSPLVAKSD